MKKWIAICLVAAAMLMLAACGSKTAPAPTVAETEQITVTEEIPVTEAPTTAPVFEPVAAGIYQRPWSEEIGGTVVERNSYIVLNEDHTGYWIVQGVATLTWDESQLKTTLGEVCDIAMTRENGSVKLLVYSDADTPSEYEKITKLPADIEAILTEEVMSQLGELDFPGTYCRTTSEEIGGAVVERKSYIVLNEDHTGYWVLQEIGTVTWNNGQMKDNLGLPYGIELALEHGSVKLRVYGDTKTPSVYVKIDKLPADIEDMIANP